MRTATCLCALIDANAASQPPFAVDLPKDPLPRIVVRV